MLDEESEELEPQAPATSPTATRTLRSQTRPHLDERKVILPITDGYGKPDLAAYGDRKELMWTLLTH